MAAVMNAVSSTSGEILIVEDTAASLRLLTEVLTLAGYTVRQAEDGGMALATVRSRLPDLILLDVAMPGMDGYAVCQELKANAMTRNIPIIFCSALHDTEYKVQGFAQGAVDFITKPYHPEEVLVRVRTHLELSRLRSSLEKRVQARTAELLTLTHTLREEVEMRKIAEQQLRLSAKAFEASFSGIMVTNQNGVILAVNPAFTRITGYSREEAIGNTPRLLNSGKHEKAFYTQLWQSLQKRGSWNGEIWNRRKDGNVVPMMESICEVKEGNDRVSHYISTLADLSESKDAQTLIDFLAYRDSLTGLANRLVARKHFEHVALDADNKQGKVAILCLDLDRFKVINDSLGHGIGDQFLKQVAAKLSACVGEGHMVSRAGGDEFLVVAANIDTVQQAVQLAHIIGREIDQEFDVDHHTLSLTASIGIALYPDDGLTFDELLKDAENALYSSKRKGGNDICLFTSQMDAAARLRMELENCMRGAVANNEFQLVYQPKVSLSSGKIVGAEALVRWNSPVLGFVSPANFIPLAEETGLILAIDEWVVTTACQQIRSWMDAGFGAHKISVNLSTLQFRRGDLSELICRVLGSSGIDASCLDLEITEGVLMENLQTAVPILEGLKAIGVSVSLDDFGTGYSSLSYLKKLPIDTLKIDKTFVDDIHLQSSDAMIALAIVSLGHNLGLKVVAEGVEYKEQHDLLREHGCDEMQGYYFSKPVSAMEFARLLAQSD